MSDYVKWIQTEIKSIVIRTLVKNNGNLPLLDLVKKVKTRKPKLNKSYIRDGILILAGSKIIEIENISPKTLNVKLLRKK